MENLQQTNFLKDIGDQSLEEKLDDLEANFVVSEDVIGNQVNQIPFNQRHLNSLLLEYFVYESLIDVVVLNFPL